MLDLWAWCDAAREVLGFAIANLVVLGIVLYAAARLHAHADATEETER